MMAPGQKMPGYSKNVEHPGIFKYVVRDHRDGISGYYDQVRIHPFQEV